MNEAIRSPTLGRTFENLELMIAAGLLGPKVFLFIGIT